MERDGEPLDLGHQPLILTFGGVIAVTGQLLELLPVADLDPAAVEFAEMQRVLIAKHPRRKRRQETETRAKAKFNQQIVAIARTEGVDTIFSDDGGVRRFAARFNIQAIGIAELTLPPKSMRGELALEPPEPDRPEPDELD